MFEANILLIWIQDLVLHLLLSLLYKCTRFPRKIQGNISDFHLRPDNWSPECKWQIMLGDAFYDVHYHICLSGPRTGRIVYWLGIHTCFTPTAHWRSMWPSHSTAENTPALPPTTWAARRTTSTWRSKVRSRVNTCHSAHSLQLIKEGNTWQ